MKKIRKVMAAAAMLAGVLLGLGHPASAVSQGTKGDELQLMQAQQLEIHLGREWIGTAFSLQTDAGIYPGIVTVDPQGVLRLEIGGSSRYILSRMKTGEAVFSVPAESETAAEEQQEPLQTDPPAAGADADSAAAIPAPPLILFGGGLTAAAAVLIWISTDRKRRRKETPESDDDL